MLQTNFVINHIKVDTMQRSEDGTVKNAVRLHDGLVVESVLIPTNTELPLVYLAKWVVV
jgi:23S rRNA (adenine2503-C2)-methyltransferase